MERRLFGTDLAEVSRREGYFLELEKRAGDTIADLEQQHPEAVRSMKTGKGVS